MADQITGLSTELLVCLVVIIVAFCVAASFCCCATLYNIRGVFTDDETEDKEARDEPADMTSEPASAQSSQLTGTATDTVSDLEMQSVGSNDMAINDETSTTQDDGEWRYLRAQTTSVHPSISPKGPKSKPFPQNSSQNRSQRELDNIVASM